MTKKRIGGLLFLLGVIALYLFTPLRTYLTRDGFEAFRQSIQGWGALGPLAYILIYAVMTVACLPGSVMTIGAGALFGTGLGFLYVVIASNLGAHLAFGIARALGRESLSGFFQRHFEKMSSSFGGSLERGGFQWVLILRLLPAVPFVAFNYAAGLTPVSYRDYTLGTLLGMLPGTFVYVWLGTAVSQVSLTDGETWKRPTVWGPFLAVILLSVVVNRFLKRQHGKI